jgi:hypothetical protein
MPPPIYAVIDKCPVPVGQHLVQGHVKKGNANFDATKSYFTDKNGTEIDFNAAINLLIAAKDHVNGLASPAAKRDQTKSITTGTKTVHAITADAGKVGFAVTWGDKVGKSRNGDDCTWICLFVTATLASGRHQWVTAYPATATYVTGKKIA